MNDENIIKDFKVLNLSIEKFSFFYGLFLIVWGFLISFVSGSGSFTSYIPSFLGLPIFIFSYLAMKFRSKKKIFMHIVVIFGILIFLGGVDLIRSFISGNAFNNIWADVSKLMMLLTGLYFSFQCVRSFIFARKNQNL